MTPQELKVSVLQLAIQGKLVEQRPEEGTGEELYKQIQAEKQELIKSKKIKKEKPLPEITEDEIPFDIPESWKWVCVAQIVTINPKNDLDDDLETAFIPMTCVMDGFRNQHTFEIKKWKEIKKGFTHFAEGDIGVAKITPCFQNRKSVIFKNLKNGYGAGTTELSVVRIISNTVLAEYLLWFFKTHYFVSNGIKSFTGTAGQQRIHRDYLASCLIPLPPLAEQKRIVAKIEELLPYIDRYEQAWSKLEEFNKKFPVDMQKSVLQMAIQGKLVEQRLEEGTGEDLFKQIQDEKQELIKSGKIKKEKPFPEITEDEIPFDIPESWMWATLGDLITVRGGKRLPVGEQLTTEPTNHVYIRVTDMKKNSVDMSDLHYVTDRVYEMIKNYIIEKEDVYIVIVGSTIGKVGIIPEELDGMNLTENAARLTPHMVDKQYLLYALTTSFMQNQFYEKTNQVGQPKLALMRLKTARIPLPPLAEQKRIVQKLEEILPLCEKLK